MSFADAIERSREIYGPLGGKFNESKLTWRMPNGGRVAFGYLENVGDAMAYQGRNLTDVWVEEVGQYAVSDPFPAGPIVFDRVLSNGRKHTVATIPARIGDNKVLLDKDPGYLDRLRLVGGQLQKVSTSGVKPPSRQVLIGKAVWQASRGMLC